MNNKELSILQLPESEPFAVGIDIPVSSPSFALQKLENFTLLFIHKGSAQVELDFRTYPSYRFGSRPTLPVPESKSGLYGLLHYFRPRHPLRDNDLLRPIFLCLLETVSPFSKFASRAGRRKPPDDGIHLQYIYGKRAYFPGTNIQELPAKLPDGYL